MTKTERFFFLALCFGMWLVLSGAGEEGTDPAGTVRSLLKSVRTLAGTESAEEGARAVREISRTFDVRGMSRAILRETWKGLSAAEQENFVALFRELLEKVAYPKSAKFFKETEIEIEDVTREDGKAEVATLVEHPEEGEVEVEYCLQEVGGRWLIEDILLDGVSLRMNLRSQVKKILREGSYEDLKRRMREKITESSPTPASGGKGGAG